MAEREAELKKCGVGELKRILKERGVGYADCVEKSDMVKKVMDTDGMKPKEKPKPSKGPTTSKQKIHKSDCIVVDSDSTEGKTDVCVIVCHGYGANNQDLASLAPMLMQGLPDLKVKMIFPNAPLSLGGGSMAWWPLDMMALFMKAQQGLEKVFAGPPPEGMDTARAIMGGLLDQVLSDTGLPMSKVVLAGFSQGSWVATDLALEAKEQPGALCVFSGAFVNQETWPKKAPARKGMKVLQTHGTQDQVLFYPFGTHLNEFFKKNEFDVDFVTFNDGHTIPQEGLTKLTKVIQDVAKA